MTANTDQVWHYTTVTPREPLNKSHELDWSVGVTEDSAPVALPSHAHASPFPHRISALCAAAGRSFGGVGGVARTTRCSVSASIPLSIIAAGTRKPLITRGERGLTAHNLYFVKSRCTAPFPRDPGGICGRTGGGFEDTDASALDTADRGFSRV